MSTPVLFCTDTFWEQWGDEVRSIAPALDPDVNVVLLVGDEPVSDADIERVTIAYFSSDVYPDRAMPFMRVCIKAPHLEWLHSMSAGTDHPVFASIRANGAVITNSAGSSAPSIAQSVVMYMLAWARQLVPLLDAQRAHDWSPRRTVDLADLRLGIYGMGAIGSATAELAQALGMDVVGVRRSPNGDEPCPTWSEDRLFEMLGRSDIVAIAAPLTDETRGRFGAAEFAAMPAGSMLVNVGRGEIVDEAALVDALNSGHLGGAALDVFETEPLPPDHPLWSTPNVIITPHVSGATERSARRARDMFFENLRRWVNGEPLNGMT